MTLNAERKKKLVDLLDKRRAAIVDVGTSTPTTLPSPATYALNSSAPAPVDKLKGVVVETSSKDEDTGSGLVFKRHRVMTPWRLRTLHLADLLQPLGTTLQVLPPLATLLCMKEGGERS